MHRSVYITKAVGSVSAPFNQNIFVSLMSPFRDHDDTLSSSSFSLQSLPLTSFNPRQRINRIKDELVRPHLPSGHPIATAEPINYNEVTRDRHITI